MTALPSRRALQELVDQTCAEIYALGEQPLTVVPPPGQPDPRLAEVQAALDRFIYTVQCRYGAAMAQRGRAFVDALFESQRAKFYAATHELPDQMTHK